MTYGRSSGMEAALQHIEDYKALERKLGPILSDVRNIFFTLDKNDLGHLICEYEAIYGRSAANYATKTYPKE